MAGVLSRPWRRTMSWAYSSTLKRARPTVCRCCPVSSNGSLEMIVFPAIDLKQGQVVRLAEGDMARATVYGDDPAAQAMLFADAGSQFLHVVDLDGSFAGRAENQEEVGGSDDRRVGKECVSRCKSRW